jgi:hypothetical protein
MAFLKFSRDRRGYEHFYLVEQSHRGKGRPHVLYWFRTPPNVRVGRSPFEPSTRRALEAQYPDVTFDWETIVHTPIPPPVEPEKWRERRRLERALRAADSEEDAAPDSEASEGVAAEIAALEPPSQDEAPLSASPEVQSAGVFEATDEAPTSNQSAPVQEGAAPGSAPPGRRRRRRGRRRGRHRPGAAAPVEQSSKPEGSEPLASVQNFEDSQDENVEP